jgi:hypothetical protein
MYFGEFLIEKGWINKDQLQRGLDIQVASSYRPIGKILSDMGCMDQTTLDHLLEEYMLRCAERLSSRPDLEAFLSN